MLNISIEFAEKISFDLEKVKTHLPSGYGDVAEFAHFLTSKVGSYLILLLYMPLSKFHYCFVILLRQSG
jgi:hypothetical protein